MKTSIYLLQALLAATAATTTVVMAQPDPNYQIDTSNKAPRLFDPPSARKGGYTYADELSAALTTEVELGGMDMKMSLDAKGDMEMVVEDRGVLGGTKTDITVKNVLANVNSFMMQVHCDSNDRGHSSHDCAELFEIVGETETIEMDDNGELVSLETFDGQSVNTAQIQEATNAMTLDSKWQANQFAASTHMNKASQMFKLIPDHAVRPGDSWIDDLDLQDLGTFKGNSQFQGYTTYKGSECAVFSFEGNLHIDISTMAKALGADPTTLPNNLTDTHVTSVIFWEVDGEFSRWAQANFTTSFDMPNPMDPTDEVPMHIPIELTMSLATDITKRPEHEVPSGGAQESYYSTSINNNHAAYSAPTKEKESSGGGYFSGIFAALAVGMVVAGGFVFYKKRQEFNQEFIRPSYQFAPVGVDEQPIMASTNPIV